MSYGGVRFRLSGGDALIGMAALGKTAAALALVIAIILLCTSLLKRWEPEPLRWLGAKGITLTYAAEEALLARQRHLPLVSPALARLNDTFASLIE